MRGDMDSTLFLYFAIFFSICSLSIGILYGVGFVGLCSYYLRKLRYRFGHKQTLCDIVLDELQPKCTSFSIKRSRKPLKDNAQGLYYGLDFGILLSPSADESVFLHEVGHALVEVGSYKALCSRFTEEGVSDLFRYLIIYNGDIKSAIDLAKESAEIYVVGRIMYYQRMSHEQAELLAKTKRYSVHWGCAVEIACLMCQTELGQKLQKAYNDDVELGI